jgi:plastocyanin
MFFARVLHSLVIDQSNQITMKKLFSALCLPALLIPLNVFATVHVVEVSDFQFSPATINVMVGDTIQWTWVSGSHTTTSTSVPAGAATWDASINSISPNTSFTYVVTAIGTYTYHCTFHSSTMTGNFSATAATSAPTLTGAAKEFNLYPNPVKNDLNISFNYLTEQAGNVRIYDLTGKAVYQMPIEIHAGSNQVVMPLAELSTGMYVAEVYAGKEKVGSRRISKD